MNNASTKISLDARKREHRSSMIGTDAVMNKLQLEHQKQQEKFHERKRHYEDTTVV